MGGGGGGGGGGGEEEEEEEGEEEERGKRRRRRRGRRGRWRRKGSGGVGGGIEGCVIAILVQLLYFAWFEFSGSYTLLLRATYICALGTTLYIGSYQERICRSRGVYSVMPRCAHGGLGARLTAAISIYGYNRTTYFRGFLCIFLRYSCNQTDSEVQSVHDRSAHCYLTVQHSLTPMLA